MWAGHLIPKGITSYNLCLLWSIVRSSRKSPEDDVKSDVQRSVDNDHVQCSMNIVQCSMSMFNIVSTMRNVVQCPMFDVQHREQDTFGQKHHCA